MPSDNRPKPNKQYGFFEFRTSERLASKYGICRGMVEYWTGDIEAAITYGLSSYREEYHGNISDEICDPPVRTVDQIILAARKIARLKGEKQVTRRRVIFLRRNGSRYMTEEFNGDRTEFAAHTQFVDRCDLDWKDLRTILSRARTHTEFIKANLEAQASYHSFLSENGNSGIVRCLRKGRETPLADFLLVVYEQPLNTGGRCFETDDVCFNPDPAASRPVCLGLKGQEKCLSCKHRRYVQEKQAEQKKGLQDRYNWPEALHINGTDVYLCGVLEEPDGENGHTPLFRILHRDRPVEDWRCRSSAEFYRLQHILEQDPSALDDQSDLLRDCPSDWYRELALHAMWSLARSTSVSHFNRSRMDAAGQTAHHITKAVFEEQSCFDPYADQSFLTAAERLLPWYIRRYVSENRKKENRKDEMKDGH